MIEDAVLGTIGFLLGLLVSSLVEYWVHVLMHRRIFLGRTHANHHREPEDDSWFKQFVYYVLGSTVPCAVVIATCWILDVTILGVGIAVGSLVWAAWVAYAHVLQHTWPEQAFWMKLPVHHLHHKYEMPKHNFGLSVDWWARVFGTYRPMPWEPPAGHRFSFRALFNVRWF